MRCRSGGIPNATNGQREHSIEAVAMRSSMFDRPAALCFARCGMLGCIAFIASVGTLARRHETLVVLARFLHLRTFET